MILPYGDLPNPKGFTPWVTWGLIAVNVLVYVLFTLPLSFMPLDPSDPAVAELVGRVVQRTGLPAGQVAGLMSAWDLTVESWGYKPGAPETRDLLASLFLHAGFAHLGGNMLFLYIYGDNVEHRLGRLPFLAFYLFSGVAATLAFGAFAGDSLTPLVGASGAISGVLGAYLWFFPRNRVKLWVFLFPWIMERFLVPAPLVLGAYVLLDNLLPFLMADPSGGGVAYGAHLGGFFAGLGVALLVGRTGAGLPRDPTPAERPPRRRRRAPVSAEERVAVAEGHAQRHDLRLAYDAATTGLSRVTDPEARARLEIVAAVALAEWGHLAEAYQHASRAVALARSEPTRRRAQDLVTAILDAR